MRERLRKIAEVAPARGVVLLGQQTHVIAELEQSFEQTHGVVVAPDQDVRIDEPEAASQERALARFETIVDTLRTVPKHETVDAQFPLDRLDGRDVTGVVRSNEPELAEQEQRCVDL